jgi:hypothetical protein
MAGNGRGRINGGDGSPDDAGDVVRVILKLK